MMEPASSSTAGMSVSQQHDELVIAVDADVLVEQLVPIAAHQRQGVLLGILQALLLQLAAEQLGEGEAGARNADCRAETNSEWPRSGR